jgi:hypothetical protein
VEFAADGGKFPVFWGSGLKTEVFKPPYSPLGFPDERPVTLLNYISSF